MISDERLEYILTTGNTRGKDAQEMAKELLALRKAWSKPVCGITKSGLANVIEYGDCTAWGLDALDDDDIPLYRKPDTGEV